MFSIHLGQVMRLFESVEFALEDFEPKPVCLVLKLIKRATCSVAKVATQSWLNLQYNLRA